eukprot:c15867_g1_i1 orf=87-887(+)
MAFSLLHCLSFSSSSLLWTSARATRALSCSSSPFLASTIISSTSLLPSNRSFLSSAFSPAGKRLFGNNPPRLIVHAARIESTSVPLASRAPNFELPEPLTGKVWKLDDFESFPALLVMFICNHCPFVAHLKIDLVKLANEYLQNGVGFVAISSNSVKTHPQDGPEFMVEEAHKLQYPFPYLYDETQEVAKAYGAVCTPDFFLFKKDGRRPFELAYHGQFDDSRPNNNKPITGRDIRNALECVLSCRPVTVVQRPSIGCSIKWHPIL